MIPAFRRQLLSIRDVLRRYDLEVSRFSASTLLGKVSKLIQQQDIDCTVDIGANIGQFAEGLQATGYRKTIVSFEPSAALFPILQKKSRASANPWLVYQLGLGSRDEERSLNIMKEESLNSLYKPNQVGRESCPMQLLDRQEIVAIRRLDTLCDSIQPIANARNIFLKVDTQGNDLEVFRGASGCYSKLRMLLMELSVIPIYDGIPDWKDTVEEVEDAGFVLAGMFPVNHTATGEVIEFDGLFVCGNRRPQLRSAELLENTPCLAG